jgi:hypothetical protein
MYRRVGVSGYQRGAGLSWEKFLSERGRVQVRSKTARNFGVVRALPATPVSRELEAAPLQKSRALKKKVYCLDKPRHRPVRDC